MENCTAIARYLKYLSSHYGYRITIKDYIGFIPKEPDLFAICDPYLIHCSAFCKYVKFNANLYEMCQNNTSRLEKKLETVSEPFVGKCYCGFYELIVPIKYNNTLLASVGVNGFEYNRSASLAAIKNVASENNLCQEDFERTYDASCDNIDLNITDIGTIITQISIFAEFLLLYYKLLVLQGTVAPFRRYSESANKLYVLPKSIGYVKNHLCEKIPVITVSNFCGCSRSHLSHVFTKYMGYSFNSFVIHLRIQKAKDLLVCSNMDLTEIASLCGYSDPNYFSVAFKKSVACSPSQYRLNYINNDIRV